MKLPVKVASSLTTTPAEGMAGLRLGEGIVSKAAYKTAADGRIAFNKDGREEFMEENNLKVGRVVLITATNSALDELDMMVVVNLI